MVALLCPQRDACRRKLAPAGSAGLDKAGRNLSPSNVFRCACARPCSSLPCSLAALLAAPAQAKLVYVKQPGTADPVVYVATDNGKHPRRLGIGRAPTISPDGRWVAFVTVPDRRRRARDRRAAAARARARSGSSCAPSRSTPCASRPTPTELGGDRRGKRVRVYDIANDRPQSPRRATSAATRSPPDSKQIVYGQADGRGLPGGTATSTSCRALGGAEPDRLTRSTGRAEPGVGAGGDRVRPLRRGARTTRPRTTSGRSTRRPETLRQLTKLMIPPLVSGLVPLEVSADGRRLLAVLHGPGRRRSASRSTPRTATDARALARTSRAASSASTSPRTARPILGHTGGPDPGAAHDVVTLPYARRRADGDRRGRRVPRLDALTPPPGAG